jgi:hypothetical protein
MHYYVLKRKYNNTYYTVRNDRNIPSIMAFPYAKQAKTMLKTILSVERHPQPIVVQKVEESFLLTSCKTSLQPVLLFSTGLTLELEVSTNMMPTDDAKMYLESKFWRA